MIFGGRGNGVLDLFDPFSVFESRLSPQFARDAHVMDIMQVDWRETAEAHIFKADLPGLRKDDMKVRLVDGTMLEISGERKKEEAQKGDTWHRVERSHGKFMRRFSLPENTNLKVDEMKGQVQYGVLTVTVPKAQEPQPQVCQPQVCQIEIA